MEISDSDSEIKPTEADSAIAEKFHSGFISGWENDTDGVETDEHPHETPEQEILWAAESGDVEMIKKLLNSNNDLTKSRDKDNYTPLHRAAYNNHSNVLNILLEHGADIHAETADKWTPLHSACHWNSARCVTQLLALDVDVNKKTKGGITPLHLAAGNNQNLETLQVLLLHPNIDATIKNNSNESALEIATRSGKYAKLFEATESCFNFI